MLELAIVKMLDSDQKLALHRDGFAHVKGFFDPIGDLGPLEEEIARLVCLVGRSAGLDIQVPNDMDAVNVLFNRIIRHDRGLGATIYDAVKNLPSMYSIVTSEKTLTMLRDVWPGGFPCVAAYGYGIRINNPSEDRYLAPWHQDVHTQGRSFRGVVVWAPLVKVTAAMGPVEFAVGSHRDGPRNVFVNNAADSIYELEILNCDEDVGRFPHVCPLTEPGDIVLIDFFTLHRSGRNVSDRSLFSIQIRYFDMNEPKGIETGWRGPTLRRMDTRRAFPELFV